MATGFFLQYREKFGIKILEQTARYWTKKHGFEFHFRTKFASGWGSEELPHSFDVTHDENIAVATLAHYGLLGPFKMIHKADGGMAEAVASDGRQTGFITSGVNGLIDRVWVHGNEVALMV